MILFIAGVFLGTTYDLRITSVLSGFSQNENGVYTLSVGWLATLLDILGEWPSPVLGAFALLIIELNFRKKLKEKGRLIFLGVSTVLTGALMFYGSHETLEALTGDALYTGHYIIMIIMTLVLTFLLRFIIENTDKKLIHRLFGQAIFTAAAAVVVLVVMEALKMSWGRVRLLEIAEMSTKEAIDPEKLFTPWYVPNWFSGSKSFPSGHTANATLLLLLPMWLGKDASKVKRTGLYAIISVWIAGMAFSRLCAGAHYLTDVLFGFAIAYVIVEITYYLYNKTFEDDTPKTKESPAKTEDSGEENGNASSVSSQQIQ